MTFERGIKVVGICVGSAGVAITLIAALLSFHGRQVELAAQLEAVAADVEETKGHTQQMLKIDLEQFDRHREMYLKVIGIEAKLGMLSVAEGDSH